MPGWQDFTPNIFLAESDFLSLTEHQKLVRPGHINEAEFEVLIREQMKLYTQSRLSSMSGAWSGSEADFNTLGALKHILLAQISARADQDLLHAKVERLLAKAESSPAAASGDAGAGQVGAGNRFVRGGKQVAKAASRRLSLCRTVLEGVEPVRAGSMVTMSASFSEDMQGRGNRADRGGVGSEEQLRSDEAVGVVAKRRDKITDKGPPGLGLDSVAIPQLPPRSPKRSASPRRAASPQQTASPKRTASPRRSADGEEVKRGGKGRGPLKAQAGELDRLLPQGENDPACLIPDSHPPQPDEMPFNLLPSAKAKPAEPAADILSSPEDEAVLTADQAEEVAPCTAQVRDRPPSLLPQPVAVDLGLTPRTEGSIPPGAVQQERSSRTRWAGRAEEGATTGGSSGRGGSWQGRTGRVSSGVGLRLHEAGMSSALVVSEGQPAD